MKNLDGIFVILFILELGKLVFFNDLNSLVWLNIVKDFVIEKLVICMIKYVDCNGKEVFEICVEIIKFICEVKVNLVIGEIIYGEWIIDCNDDIFNGY